MKTVLIVNSNIIIPESELSFNFVRSGGSGGQNVNKVNSKATLRWNPLQSEVLPASVKQRFIEKYQTRLTNQGEIVIVSDRFREQKMNISDCIEKLQAMLLLVLYPPKKRKKTKPTRTSIEKRLSSKQRNSAKKIQRRRQYPDD